MFKLKQRDADTVDLWLTNSFLLPITVRNASLSPNLQGVLKVSTTAASNDSNPGYKFSHHTLRHDSSLCCPLCVR